MVVVMVAALVVVCVCQTGCHHVDSREGRLNRLIEHDKEVVGLQRRKQVRTHGGAAPQHSPGGATVAAQARACTSTASCRSPQWFTARNTLHTACSEGLRTGRHLDEVAVASVADRHAYGLHGLRAKEGWHAWGR